MRVLVVASTLKAGGAERQWEMLAAGLQSRGHDVRFLALKDGGEVATSLTERRIRVDVAGLGSVSALAPAVLGAATYGYRPNVVVSGDTLSLAFSAFASRLVGAIHVYTEHRQVGNTHVWRREQISRAASRWLDAVVLVDERQRPLWAARPSAPQLYVIRNGVTECSAARDVARRSLGASDADVVAIMTATLRAEKRVLDFISVIERCQRQAPNVLGVVIGGGEEYEAARALVGDNPRIRLLGYRQDASKLVAGGDVFVLLSDMEAQPVAILEAMSARLPVVATDVGAVSDVVVAGKSGFLVPSRDTHAATKAVLQLVDDLRLRDAYGQAAFDLWRTRWSADRMVGQYEALFEELIGLASPPEKRRGV